MRTYGSCAPLLTAHLSPVRCCFACHSWLFFSQSYSSNNLESSSFFLFVLVINTYTCCCCYVLDHLICNIQSPYVQFKIQLLYIHHHLFLHFRFLLYSAEREMPFVSWFSYTVVSLSLSLLYDGFGLLVYVSCTMVINQCHPSLQPAIDNVSVRWCCIFWAARRNKKKEDFFTSRVIIRKERLQSTNNSN